jgi:hypothetical protein
MQGNRLSLRAAPCIVGMQMVSTVVSREQLRRMSRIAYNRIEINHAVEFFAAENPGVDLLSHPFFLRSVQSDRRPRRPQIQKRVFERCEKLKSIQEAVTLLSQCQYLRRTRAWHYCNPITVCDDYVVWIYCDAIALNVDFSAVYDVISISLESTSEIEISMISGLVSMISGLDASRKLLATSRFKNFPFQCETHQSSRARRNNVRIWIAHPVG